MFLIYEWTYDEQEVTIKLCEEALEYYWYDKILAWFIMENCYQSECSPYTEVDQMQNFYDEDEIKEMILSYKNK